MTVTVRQGDRPALRLVALLLHAPERGPWTAVVRVEPGDLPPTPGAIEIADGTTTWRGTVRAASRDGSTVSLDVIGGAACLGVETTSRHWAAATSLGAVLAILCADAGESPSAEPGPLLASWRARGGVLSVEVARLAGWATSGAWRIGPDGLVTIAAPAWADAARPGILISVGQGAVRYECSGVPDLVGRVVDGRRVAETLLVSGPSGVPTIDTWESRPGSTAAGRTGTVGATVESQSDGRADLRLDDGTALSDVPLWHGPGVRAIVPSGTRVLVLDLGDDPRAPLALSAPWDSTVDELRLADAHAPVLRVGDVIMMPSGAAAIPTPVPILLGPGIVDPGPPGTGRSRVLA